MLLLRIRIDLELLLGRANASRLEDNLHVLLVLFALLEDPDEALAVLVLVHLVVFHVLDRKTLIPPSFLVASVDDLFRR